MLEVAPSVSCEELVAWVEDARSRTFDLVADLTDEQMIGPRLPTINPLMWEIGHAAWFYERWVLRHVAKQGPLRNEVDSLYDSITIEHPIRWDLPILPRKEILLYLAEVRDRVIDVILSSPPSEELDYFVKLAVFHEDMHTEAFTYTRQTLGYRPPQFATYQESTEEYPRTSAPAKGDVDIPGGIFMLGASRDEPFVFDNEQWAHPVDVRSFSISRTAVTQGEFAQFANDQSYSRRDLWSEEGWKWREATQAEQPLYWQCESNGNWLRRDFDRWVSLEPDKPMIHVNWHEAQAYCRWAGRRLPNEAEWEVAAASTMNPNNESLALEKHRFPWGDEPPTSRHARMDWQLMGTATVDQLSEGDSQFSCRQMIGNVWEWTDTTFNPYPDFSVGPYKEYSQSCFGECKVLRGGCWVTRSRMIRNTWRNYYRPDRRDIWSGFRTCALN